MYIILPFIQLLFVCHLILWIVCETVKQLLFDVCTDHNKTRLNALKKIKNFFLKKPTKKWQTQTGEFNLQWWTWMYLLRSVGWTSSIIHLWQETRTGVARHHSISINTILENENIRKKKKKVNLMKILQDRQRLITSSDKISTMRCMETHTRLQRKKVKS